MSKKKASKDVKIIIQYENNADEKEKSLQTVMQKLFNLYIAKVVQNINKGK